MTAQIIIQFIWPSCLKNLISLALRKYLDALMKPIVQISLDLTNIDEALETAAMAMRAGVDWLEAGTPLILAEGLHGVRELRKAFPKTQMVDLKTMDGGYLEAEMMAKAGASYVVVMAHAHEETIKCVVKAGKDYGIGVMGDNLGCPDIVKALRSDRPGVWLCNPSHWL